MSLPPAQSRKIKHRRTITSEGFLREDGLWDIEARMVDIKTEDSELIDRGHLPAGTAFHDMSIRLTIDQDMLVHDAEASIDASPFAICPQIATNFKRLSGLRIGKGWRAEAATQVGNAEGCTHLNELLPVLATTAFQTLLPNPKESDSLETVKALLNTCHTWSQESPMIQKHFPEHYQPQNSDEQT